MFTIYLLMRFSWYRSALVQVFHLEFLLQLSSLILLCDISALIVELLTSCETNLHFYETSLKVYLERH